MRGMWNIIIVEHRCDVQEVMTEALDDAMPVRIVGAAGNSEMCLLSNISMCRVSQGMSPVCLIPNCLIQLQFSLTVFNRLSKPLTTSFLFMDWGSRFILK